MSRHRWNGDDPEKPRPSRRDDGPAPDRRPGGQNPGAGPAGQDDDGRVNGRAGGGRLNGSARNGSARNGSAVNGSAVRGTPVDRPSVNGSARNRGPRPTPRPRVNGSAPNGSAPDGDGPRHRRGTRAQPSSIADFARTDRTAPPRDRDAAGSPGGDVADDTTRIPAARDGDGAERTVARWPVLPAQRDRSDESGPHRPADRTVARPPACPPAVPSPRPAPVHPAPAHPPPVRPARDGPARDGPAPAAPDAPARAGGPAPVRDAEPTAPVAAVRPAVADPDTVLPAALTTPAAPGRTDHTAGRPGEPRADDRADDRADPAPVTTAVPAPPATTGPQGNDPEPTPSRNRLLGVDVARGVALFGIIAVHALVEGTEDGAPATNYLVFGGRSAALFALLAGVALAFMTSRGRVRWGRDFGSAAAMVAARAGVLLVLGLSVGWTDPEIAAVILPYYAIMFLLAIPLLVLPTGVLAVLTVVLVGAVPVLSQWIRPALPVPTLDNPHLVDLVTDPLGLLSELTITGAYPAMTWLAYLAAGLAIGRLRLSSLRTAWMLLGAGTAAALAAWGASWWLLGPAGGYAHIAAATPPEQLATAPTVADFVSASPDGTTPTTTWWWLATIAPHSGTPLDLAQTTGSAVALLGAALLLAGITAPAVARPLGYLLRPVAAAGSMTLTLYVASLLFMNSGLDDFGPLEGYLWQIGAAVVIGTAWRRAIGRGPLEALTSTVATAARNRVRRGPTRDRVGASEPTGPSVADGRARR